MKSLIEQMMKETGCREVTAIEYLNKYNCCLSAAITGFYND